MSERDEALRDMAANRGCRLQKSRRRKPGGDFGRYGLKDVKTGAEVFGFGPKGLTATAEEIEAFLRGDVAAGWKSSLRAVGKAPATPPRPEQARKASEKPSKKTGKPEKEKPKKSGKPEKTDEPVPLVVREARPKDAEAVAGLIRALGYEMSTEDVRRRLAKARKRDEPVLVADRGGIVGCLSWHVTPVLHRQEPVGRITMMAVAEEARSQESGTALAQEAEARLLREGCGLVEVTSNMKRMRAHDFYERLGFERTSYRFAKKLTD